jgi:hypothetical protein
MKFPYPLAALRFAAFLSILLTPLLINGPALAGEGHNHGNAAPAVTGPALPRFVAVSETFELVGVLSGKQITLYLDRAADNAPVTGAQIELEIAGTKLNAEKHDDTYEVMLAAAPKPGVLPITATVTAGKEVDLLAGELDLHEEALANQAAHAHSWKEVAGWSVAAVAALVILILIGYRFAASRQRRAGASA